MDYEERPPPHSLNGFVKAFWRLRAGDDQDIWLDHLATPDGSIEIIRRDCGESIWHRPQPHAFAAGMTTRPATLRMRGDATFYGIRIWPWTWHILGGEPCNGFIDDWIGLAPGSQWRAIADRLGSDDVVEQLILDTVAGVPDAATVRALGLAILMSATVAEVTGRTTRSHRWLQRWAQVHVGMPLRTYLRLLRFQSALADVQLRSNTLAQSATASGYADQAHMARTFRELAGEPALHVRTRAVGPFLKGGQHRPIR